MNIYVVYDKQNKEFWKAGAKVAWGTPGAASNAVINKCSHELFPKKYTHRSFKDQDRYEVLVVSLDTYLEHMEICSMLFRATVADLEEIQDKLNNPAPLHKRY